MQVLADFFSHLYRFDELIRWGGYLVLIAIVFAETGLLVGFFLPGDSLLVTAGLVAATGQTLDVWLLILLLSAAAIAGDSTGYAIGYHLGSRLFTREESFLFRKAHVERTRRFYERYGGKTIILARFVPIIRTFAPSLAGVGKMAYRRFFLFNIVGGIGWVTSMILVGFFLGRSVPGIEHRLHWVIAVVIGLSVIPIVREWLSARRRPGADPS